MIASEIILIFEFLTLFRSLYIDCVKIHENFFAWECRENLNTIFSENTEVVCETFEKVD